MKKLKAIQSYVPFNAGLDPDACMGKPYTYLAMLSGLQLKKLYGEVTLYTNNSMGEFFDRLNFPHTIDTSLEGEGGEYFAMPKLKAFMKQDKPFVHFDLDSLVFQKPAVWEKDSPYVFSHPDMPNNGYDKVDRRYPKKKHKTVNALIQDVWFDNLMESYLLAFYNCESLPEDYPSHLINPNNIPNMNIIGVKNPEVFKEATKIAMEIADKNKHIFTNNWLASNFIEQLTIPLYLEVLDEGYKNALKAHKEKNPIGSPFTFAGDPFTCLGFPEDEPKWQNLIPPYPFKFQHFYQCGECLDWHKTKHLIDSDESLYKGLDLSQYKFCHIGGGNKDYALWQAMVIHTIVENYGEQHVLDITEFYRIKDEGANKRLKYTEGELTYEKLTGNKLFTEKHVSQVRNLLI